MLNRGLNLGGFNALAATSSGNVAKIEGNVQTITTSMESGRYTPIIVQKGVPVKWTINAQQSDLNGCNNPVTIPKYNIEKKLVPGDNLIEFTPEDEGNITYTCWMGMISSNIKVVADVTKVTEKDIQQTDNTSNLGIPSSGGCCAAGAKATKFSNGKIPTDNILVAKVIDKQQEVTININDEGYSPAVVVLQKGIPFKIKFNPEKLNSCNSIVAFPEYKGQLNIQKGQTETPSLDSQKDFIFQCGMGMLHGYVKVVNDINNVDIEKIKTEVANYKLPAGSGGCCGG
jgi:plastocyanin domain-containing protein